ncbi:MAG TPA: hypothetical protein VF160_02260 [Candidatus Dormibacteraeota bacterium]
MTGTTLTIVVVLAIVVLLLLIVVAARRGRTRRLPEQSRQRYATQWQDVRTRFIEDPHGAVAEADQLVMAMLREQGIDSDRGRGVPDDLEKARRAARLDQGSGATEDLRTSMLHYQRIVDRGIGESTRKAAESRREIA